MKILLSDLKKLCEQILTRVEKCGFNEIDINNDYYLTILNPYDLYNKDPEIGVGSCDEDWDWLKKVLNNENPVTIVDFNRLGNVIKILGDQIEKTKDPFFIDTFFGKK